MVLHISPDLVYTQQLIQCTRDVFDVHCKFLAIRQKPNQFDLVTDTVDSVLSKNENTENEFCNN